MHKYDSKSHIYTKLLANIINWVLCKKYLKNSYLSMSTTSLGGILYCHYFSLDFKKVTSDWKYILNVVKVEMKGNKLELSLDTVKAFWQGLAMWLNIQAHKIWSWGKSLNKFWELFWKSLVKSGNKWTSLCIGSNQTLHT